MNDPNKAINVNLSSLLSLKAELLRKQAEVSKAKASQASASEFVVNKSTASTQSATTKSKKHKKDKAQEHHEKETPKEVELEDSEMLLKSQRILAAKSKFYEKMTRSGGKLNSDDNCLVMFNRKKQEESSHSYPIGQYVESDSSDDDDDDHAHNEDNKKDNDSHHSEDDYDDEDDDDWVEYIDCLGRTRKCLRQDLDAVKKRDKELADSMPERLDQSKANWMIDTSRGENHVEDDNDDDLPIGPMPPESVFGDSTMSKLEEQKVNWERKERENLDKSEVHYQDVFFDEARQHGVGYYAFSTDEEERQKQQRELEKRREQTLAEQKHREELRTQREKIIAERVRAAKNRQRARQGLPPLAEGEDEPKPADIDADDKPTTEETKDERKARKRAEKLKKRQELEEQQREQERLHHIRPWDKEKGGTKAPLPGGNQNEEHEEWSYKPEREPMSQEQWNELKRGERNKEFGPVPEAPPTLKRTNFSSVPPPPPTLYDMAPPPTNYGPRGFTTFQSTKRENRSFQRRNYEAPPPEESYEDEMQHRARGATIPPPSSLDADCTLPPHAKKSKSAIELERSIEAGLRFLRNNCDKGTLTTKSSWTAKADY